MATVNSTTRSVTVSQQSSSSNTLDTQQFNDDCVWQELIGIAPDPPVRRKKCEKC